MIVNYLIELLKDNECIIVPGFGAFISKRHSATIDYANHRFMPPYKEIVFNEKLNSDDDVLLSFVSEKENVSKEEASKKVQAFVNQSMATLEVGSELLLDGIGKIRRFGNDYVLKTEEDANLLGDSFGLTDFNYKPIFRTETYQIIKEKIIIEQKEKNAEYSIAIESVETVEDSESTFAKRKPSLLKTLAYSTLAFMLLFVINWTTDKSDSNLASWNPFLYSSPNEFIIKALEVEHNEEAQVVQYTEFADVIQAEVPEELTVIEANVTSEETLPEVEVTEDLSEEQNIVVPCEKHYYIVGGSFQTAERAEKCLNDIKGQGFENASLLEKNEKGYIRVFYESFADKDEAKVRLEVIKSDFNESAWLLFQK